MMYTIHCINGVGRKVLSKIMKFAHATNTFLEQATYSIKL